MAMGNNRDYKTREKLALRQLAKHHDRMMELVAQGLSHFDASAQAYNEMRQAAAAKRAKREAKSNDELPGQIKMPDGSIL